jgi:hypothetical protein
LAHWPQWWLLRRGPCYSRWLAHHHSSSFGFWHIGHSGGSYEEGLVFPMRGFRFLNSPTVGRRPNMGRELGTGRVSKDLAWPRDAPDHVRRCRSIAYHMAKHSTFGMPTRGTMFCIGLRLLVSWVRKLRNVFPMLCVADLGMRIGRCSARSVSPSHINYHIIWECQEPGRASFGFL